VAGGRAPRLFQKLVGLPPGALLAALRDAPLVEDG